ncbi:hypothetical protein PGC35_07285 [Psychrobacillus sp. PGGUH221]
MRMKIFKVLEHRLITEMIYMKDSGEMSKSRVKVSSVSKDSFKA